MASVTVLVDCGVGQWELCLLQASLSMEKDFITAMNLQVPQCISFNHCRHFFALVGPVKEHIVATLSNGLDWNLKDDIMYFIDSVSSRCLYSFSYQRETGTLSNQQPLVDYNQHSDLAMPDGMCRDTQGRLWVCSFGGQCVTCWSPAGEKLMDMEDPWSKVCYVVLFWRP